MAIEIKKLDIAYCNDMSTILNSDEKLHLALTPNTVHIKITDNEYYDGCRAWETRKNGSNYVIFYNDMPIGSISYYKKNDITAGCGYWIKSSLWGKGYGKESFSLFLPIIKKAGFKYVTASILKNNNASLKIWAKYTTNIKEDFYRYIPTIELT